MAVALIQQHSAVLTTNEDQKQCIFHLVQNQTGHPQIIKHPGQGEGR